MADASRKWVQNDPEVIAQMAQSIVDVVETCYENTVDQSNLSKALDLLGQSQMITAEWDGD